MWLDGDSEGIDPMVRFSVQDASQQIIGSGHSLDITTVTSTANNAQTGSEIQIEVFGSLGHVGPMVLTGSYCDEHQHFMCNGATQTFHFDIGDIGTLSSVRLFNSGNDGWKLDTLTVSDDGQQQSWDNTISPWLDGDGSSREMTFTACRNCRESSVTIRTMGQRSARTNSDVYIRLNGTRAGHTSTGPIFMAHGLDQAGMAQAAINHPNVGQLISVELMVSGSGDGFHLSLLELEYNGRRDYLWPTPVWVGDDATQFAGCAGGVGVQFCDRLPPSVFWAEDASPLGPGNNENAEIVITTLYGQNNGQALSNFVVIVFGSRGHWGPEPLPHPNSTAANTFTFPLEMGHVGSFESLNLYNAGSGQVAIGEVSFHREAGQMFSFPVNDIMDGAGARERVFENADCVATSVVFIEASEFDGADTAADVFVTIVGSQGTSEELLFSHGLSPMIKTTRTLCHERIGNFEELTLRIDSEDGAHVNEIGIDSNIGTKRRRQYVWPESVWVSGSRNSCATCRDHVGDNFNPSVEFGESERTFTSDEALPAARGSGHHLTIQTLTGDISNAQTESTIVATVYGTLGYIGPVSLNDGRIERRATDIWDYPGVGDIGELTSVRLLNTGNDGWKLSTLTVTFDEQTQEWDNDGCSTLTTDRRHCSNHAWLDGDGDEYGQSRAALYEVCSDCVTTTVSVTMSEVSNSQTSNDVYISFVGTSGTADEQLFAHGLPHMDRVTREIQHADVGDLVSVSVHLWGNVSAVV